MVTVILKQRRRWSRNARRSRSRASMCRLRGRERGQGGVLPVDHHVAGKRHVALVQDLEL